MAITLDIVDPLYYKFQLFMKNATLIRYGPIEKVASRRLLNLFNQTHNENVSFNRVFPRLMSQYMERFPEHNLAKRNMTDGVFYFGVGLVSDPPPTDKVSPLTTKEKNDRRKEKQITILNELKHRICERTNWSEVEYQYLIDLRLINIIRTDKTFNIDGTIASTIGKLTVYISDEINELNKIVRSAEIVKMDYERCHVCDLNLTTSDMAQRFTDRLAAAERTYAAGHDLEKSLNYYLNRADKLPRLPYIVYPNIQYLMDLITWLKSHSKYRVELEMKQTHIAYETLEQTDPYSEDIDEIFDTDTRLTHAIVE